MHLYTDLRFARAVDDGIPTYLDRSLVKTTRLNSSRATYATVAYHANLHLLKTKLRQECLLNMFKL